MVAGAIGVAPGVPHAAAQLPSLQPDDTGMVNGEVRTIAQAGGHIWVGGSFTQMQNANGSNVRAVENLAAFDEVTGAPELALSIPGFTKTGGSAILYDMSLGPDGKLYITGKFSKVNGLNRGNVAAIDPSTGALLPFNANSATGRSIHADGDAVYVGTKKLLKFTLGGGAYPGWSEPVASTDPSLRTHTTQPQMRDISPQGGALFVACQCDSVADSGGPQDTKALIKVDPATGDLLTWKPANLDQQGGAFGIMAVVHTDPTRNDIPVVYLAGGGSDFAAAYNVTTGAEYWKTDTSGSSQAVAFHQDTLIVGGHFEWVAKNDGQQCGANQSPNTSCWFAPRLVAMSLDDGDVILQGGKPWNPGVCCIYAGVWELEVDAEGGRLHVGGEFTRMGGTWTGSGTSWTLTGSSTQNFYGRLFAPPLGSWLTVSGLGQGSGSVTSDIGGIDCPAVCLVSYPAADTVTLSASADPGSTFAGWSGEGCAGTGTCTITMDRSRTVTATFSVPYDLNVSVVGDGSVTSDVGGIACPATSCSGSIPSDADVALTAVPGPGQVFSGWFGAGCAGTQGCVVTMSSNHAVTAPFVPTPPASCGRILFRSNRTGDQDIWMMNADGTNESNLTNRTGKDTDAAWSPDCTQLAFASTRSGNEDIYVMNADGSGTVRLTTHTADDTDPSWSPDGSRIAFVSTRTGNADVWVMDADGGNQANLTNDPATDGAPDWSPDGAAIAFDSTRGGGVNVWTMAADGTGSLRLTDGLGRASSPSWSPSGATIAFVSDVSGKDQVWVMGADGSTPTRSTNDSGTHAHPTWSPDGTALAYSSTLGGKNQIWTIELGGAGVNTSTSSANDILPAWAP